MALDNRTRSEFSITGNFLLGCQDRCGAASNWFVNVQIRSSITINICSCLLWGVRLSGTGKARSEGLFVGMIFPPHIRVRCTRKFRKKPWCNFSIRTPWSDIRGCRDGVVKPAVLVIRDIVRGGIYVSVERRFDKVYLVHIAAPHRLPGALQKRRVSAGLWNLSDGPLAFRGEDRKLGR